LLVVPRRRLEHHFPDRLGMLSCTGDSVVEGRTRDCLRVSSALSHVVARDPDRSFVYRRDLLVETMQRRGEITGGRLHCVNLVQPGEPGSAQQPSGARAY
jgi:hypothetical protein